MSVENLFDENSYPSDIPAFLRAGDRWAWRSSALSNAYEPQTEYRLTYELDYLEGDADTQTITANDEFIVEQADTAVFEGMDGEWRWTAKVERRSDQASVVAGQGFVRVESQSSAPSELTLLRAIEAVLAQTATREQASYSLAGRMLRSRTPDELIRLRAWAKRQWNRRRDASRRRQGRGRRSVRMIPL